MFAWLRRRDEKIYPANELGNALYKCFPDPAKMPASVELWFDAYFDTEADADAISADCDNRRIEVERDYDEEDNDGFGPWNVDFSVQVRARYQDISYEFERSKRLIEGHNGRFQWLLGPADPPDD